MEHPRRNIVTSFTIIRADRCADDSAQTVLMRKLFLIVFLSTAVVARVPQAEAEETQKHVPSRAFLDFLLDFSETDDESFDMLIENGKEDIRRAQDANVENAATAPAKKEPEATP